MSHLEARLRFGVTSGAVQTKGGSSLILTLPCAASWPKQTGSLRVLNGHSAGISFPNQDLQLSGEGRPPTVAKEVELSSDAAVLLLANQVGQTLLTLFLVG